jgi:GNAT superfamily N-acetyltransferase
MQLRELSTAQELETVFPVLKELRTDLDFDRFMTLYRAARDADRFTVLGYFEDGRAVALMGYRILYDLVHGKHLYVDELVVTEKLRSRGLGSKLLKRAEEIAKREGCDGLRLCTGVDNLPGRRFYEREGWAPRALAFKKKCDS